jgi:hypothetical protein
MLAEQARTIGRDWVASEAARLPGFRGALWHGSILTMPGDEELPASSDIDIVLVVDDPAAQPALGKIVRDGVLLDVSFVGREETRDPEALLADHSLAPTFRAPELLADPDGGLAEITGRVGRDFARRGWVERRCASAVARIERNMVSLDPVRPFPANVMAWLFGTGVTTHVLLVAGLRNPTVRKRYLAVRELLDEVGMPEVYGELLDLLGCRDWTPAMATRHLDALAGAFDAAGEAIRTPVPFANDLSPAARAIAIDGSRELIEAGHHRAAVFWIVATWTRCMTVFHTDAPALENRFGPGFRATVADLGIASDADLRRRADEVIARLPRLTAIAGAIMDATPEIEF